MSRAKLGDEWPLTVKDGVLGCDGQDGVGAATITTDGTRYALNGTAVSAKAGSPVDPIWAANPESPGTKKNIGALIERALVLCD